MKDSQIKRDGSRDNIRSALNIKIPLDLYAWILILFLILMVIPHRLWFVETFSHVIHWFLLPSIPVFIILAIKRRWISTAVWGVPTLGFLILFGSLFLPNFGPKHICETDSTSSCVHLRVMTYNLLAEHRSDYQQHVNVMLNSGADIIAIQEINDAAEFYIDTQLAEIYPYRVLNPGGIAGTGIISKYPIESHEFFQLAGNVLTSHSMAVIDIGGVTITVFSAHPPPPISPGLRSLRRTGIRVLSQKSSTVGPVLLLGDFNITDQSSDYRILTRAGLHDAYREKGWGFGSTWPARLPKIGRFLPLARIDYIWHTEEFEVISVWNGPRTPSDHLAVIADVAFVQ